MPQLYRTKLWQVVLPDGWRVSSGRYGDECVTIWNPKGFGMLTVMSIDEIKAPPRDGQGRHFSGKLQGQTYDLSDGNLSVRHWKLLCGAQWFSVRYSCAPKNAEFEQAEIDEILQTISETV
jgi:hypothetical protein